MLEIASNFRISLDLFELANFITNYGFQTTYKDTTGRRKWFCDMLAHSRQNAVLR